ncbi:hypothetical protein ASG72_02460 [Bosea sp. Leaf344]|nr:hypothetical protein ASG72_02460 [Bosea sp. Leaf344]
MLAASPSAFRGEDGGAPQAEPRGKAKRRLRSASRRVRSRRGDRRAPAPDRPLTWSRAGAIPILFKDEDFHHNVLPSAVSAS